MSAWAWGRRSSGRTSLPDPATQFKLTQFESAVGPIALVTIDNGEDYSKPNVFGRAAFDSLERALEELEGGEWAALVLTGKPFVFAAGADLRELPELSTPELAREGSKRGHALFLRIAALPYPTVAAINGACLGGGVELALHCGARTISSAVRHFAAPECLLGIIPGWGGTQLVPRLVGTENAVKFIVANPLRQNRMLDGRAAYEFGFADRLLEPTEFLDESIAFALELVRADRPLEREPPSTASATETLSTARARLDGQVHGAATAPYRALELIAGACSGWSLEAGYAAEEEAIAELLPGREAQASLYAFELVERRSKLPPPAMTPASARPVSRLGIVGAGLMARQLATLALRRLELPIVIRDVDAAQVEAALEFVADEVEGLVARGRIDAGRGRHLRSLVNGTTGYEGFADCDVVLEAVVEQLAVKQQVLAELEQIVTPDCVLATNTSALRVAELGAVLEHPERLVGLHFFNPVAILPLVELVRGPRTDAGSLATAWKLASDLKKRVVLVADAPAFVVNRVLTRLLVVVLDALEHGNTVEETDKAILRLGLPMPPSLLLQLVGPRVANDVLETLHAAYPERFPLSQTLAAYAEGRDQIVLREERRRTQEELLGEVLDALADEIGQILNEGVVERAADVDTALLLGAGWPFWLGGITKHLDQIGVSERVLGRPLAEFAPSAAS